MDPPAYPSDRKEPSGPSSTRRDPQGESSNDLPPPSYRETVNPNIVPPTSQQLGLLPPSQPGNVQRFPDQRGPRLLHLNCDSPNGSNLTILAPDQATIAYTVAANVGKQPSEKPQLRVYRGDVESQASSTPVGTVSFRPSRKIIDLTLHGRETLLESEGLLGRTHGFESPGIGRLRWEREGLGSNMKLVNGRGEWIARFESKASADKRGVLEIVSWEIDGRSLDEIVVSGAAMSEWMKRKK